MLFNNMTYLLFKSGGLPNIECLLVVEFVVKIKNTNDI